MSRHVAPTQTPRRRGANPLDVARRRTRLRRAVALAGMLAAVGGTVTLRASLAPAAGPAMSASGLAAPVHSTSSTTTSTHHRKHRHTTSAPASPSARPRPTRQQVTGDAFNVGYGIVQVRVTMVGKRITDVTALSLPSGGNSGAISSYAGPQLRREALSAQSANIDAVSGASYTSAGYARSLQSALDKAAQG